MVISCNTYMYSYRLCNIRYQCIRVKLCNKRRKFAESKIKICGNVSILAGQHDRLLVPVLPTSDSLQCQFSKNFGY